MNDKKMSYSDFLLWKANYIRSKRYLRESLVDAFIASHPQFKLDKTIVSKEHDIVNLICE